MPGPPARPMLKVDRLGDREVSIIFRAIRYLSWFEIVAKDGRHNIGF